MNPKRILFVEASVGGVLGGSLTGILHLIARLDRQRFAPVLVLYEEKHVIDELRADGVEVHVLPPLPRPAGDGDRGRLGRAWLRLREIFSVTTPRARALRRLFQREQPDLVYLANGITTNLDALIAAALCGLPVINHEKGLRRLGPVERFWSRWVNVCIGMTDQVTEHVRVRGARCGRFLTIYDGINCDAFAPGGGDAVRREFAIPAGAPVVGIVGHLQRWKGQLVVAEAVARARQTHPDLRCLIVGGVHSMGEDYAAELRARTEAPDLAGHVVLTGARRDVPACIDAMDVVIHSSIRPEPFGRVLIEAMALGRPLIAPREGGPVEVVVDGETGLLVTPRDPAALAEAIVALVGDEPRRLAMGRAARERIDHVFDIRHHVRAIEAVFEETLHRGRESAPPVARAATAR
jgi:glycosyltransferase involved in cell wall biosynthesis